MPGPFEDGETDATEEELALLKKNLGEQEEPEGEPMSVEEDPPTRKEKKQQRMDDYHAMKEELAEMKGRMDAQSAQLQRPVVVNQPAPPEADPLDAEEDSIFEAKQGKWAEFQRLNEAGQLTPEKKDALTKEVRALDKKAFQVEIKRNERSRPRQQSPAEQYLMSRHPDVMSDPKARAFASGTYQRIAATGRTDEMKMIEEAAKETREQFGMTSIDATAQQRKAHTGIPQGGGAAASKNAPKTIVMTDEYKRMADAAYSDILDDKERHRHWAKTVGKKILARKS